MVYLLLAIASSAMIAIIMRISARWVKGSISMLAVNYLTCLLLGAGFAGFQLFAPGRSGLPVTVAMGGFNGLVYLAGFVLMQYNTRKSGVVLSSVFMKLGLLVPLILSIFLFREIPTALQWVGFVLAVGAIVLSNYEKGAAHAGSSAYLVLMLLCGGSGDAMSKVFEVYGPRGYADQFLFYTFLSAFLLCIGLILWKKERPDKAALLFGVAVGVPNFFSAKFLLMALGQLPGVIVYPTFSVATILTVSVAGICLFKERLRRSQWVALMVILAALVLLNI